MSASDYLGVFCLKWMNPAALTLSNAVFQTQALFQAAVQRLPELLGVFRLRLACVNLTRAGGPGGSSWPLANFVCVILALLSSRRCFCGWANERLMDWKKTLTQRDDSRSPLSASGNCSDSYFQKQHLFFYALWKNLWRSSETKPQLPQSEATDWSCYRLWNFVNTLSVNNNHVRPIK